MSVIISVVNNKGGVGKTTVTCNLSHALAKKGKKVLVVDIDSQCNATSLLVPDTTSLRYSIYDILEPGNDTTPDKCVYGTEYANLYCVPNIPDTASLEPQLIYESPKSLFFLRERFRDYALENFDITIIDNPPNMGTFVICSLYSSDFVIVTNQAGSSFSLEGLLKAIVLINEVREQGNPNLRFLRLLINQVDKRTTISRATITQIKQNFKPDQFFITTIPINTAFQQAESLKQTIFKFSPHAAGARAYRLLAQELLEILDNQA